MIIHDYVYMYMYRLQNMYLSFGDIGANIKKLVDEFQDRQKSHAKIESIADMKVRGKSCMALMLLFLFACGYLLHPILPPHSLPLASSSSSSSSSPGLC